MTNIKIKKLKITNFKGIRSLEIDTGCESIKIFGDNATGKTTIFDAVTWVLFDKNSQNAANFGIKTIINGEELHKVEHEVEIVFFTTNNEWKLRKIYKEVWKKIKGRAQETFSGHTTEHYVGDVPVRASVYKDAVSKIIKEDLFKLLTNPGYFNSVLSWQERRNIVMEVAGQLSDQEIIDKNKDLVELNDIASGKSIDDIKKMLKAQATIINKKIEELPIRIGELEKTMLDLPNETIEQLEFQKEKLQQQINELMEQAAEINVGSNTTLKSEAAELLRQIDDAKHLIAIEQRTQKDENEKLLSNWENNLTEAQWLVTQNKKTIESTIIEVDALEKAKNKLISSFDAVSSEAYQAPNITDKCEYCGSTIPKEKIEEIKLKINQEKDNFNRKKAIKLKEINNDGKTIAEHLEIAKATLEQQQAQLQQSKKNLEEAEIKPLISDIKIKKELTENLKKLKEEYTILQTKINTPSSATETLEANKTEQVKLNTIIAKLNNDIAAISTANKTQQRIEELKSEGERLSHEYSDVQHKIYLCEEFVRVKVAAVEENINKKFELARFKLFEENISNDGITEACITMYNGVEYNDLNNAAQINIGLDVIKTLQTHYKAKAPIFVDNAEAITELLDMQDTQTIKLIVSAEHKKLKIERE